MIELLPPEQKGAIPIDPLLLEATPATDQCFVSQLDKLVRGDPVAADDEEPGVDERPHDLTPPGGPGRRVGRVAAPSIPPSFSSTRTSRVRTRGNVLEGGRQSRELILRPLADRALDSSDLLIRLVGELSAPPPLPEFREGEFQEREVPRLADNLVQDAIHQPRFENRFPRRNGPVPRSHDAARHESSASFPGIPASAVFQIRAELPRLAVIVTPQGNQDRDGQAIGHFEQLCDERPLIRRRSQCEEFLKLIDHDEPSGLCPVTSPARRLARRRP